MKRNIFCFLSIIFCLSTGYSQNILWERSYGGQEAEYLMDIQPTADYGFILAGSSSSKKTGNKTQENRGDFDYWIWKMDENGEFVWQKSFGGPGTDFLQSFRSTRDGGFILAGVSNSSTTKDNKQNDKKEDSRGGDDFWIIKLNAQGAEEWQKTIGGTGQEKLKSICPTVDGGYILGGSSNSNTDDEKTESYGNMDYWIVKLDRKGEIEWQKTFGGIYNEELRSIEQTKDRGYILGGYSNSPMSGNKEKNNLGLGDYWVLKLGTDGAIQWQASYGGDQDDQLSVVHQTYDGNYILGGYSNSNATESKVNKDVSGSDFLVIKIDETGKVLWEEKYSIGDVDRLTSLVENEDHSLLLGGYAQSETRSPYLKDANEINDYVAIKTSELGEELWRKSVGSSGEDVLKKAIETRDGGYILAGTSNPTKSNNLPERSSNSTKKTKRGLITTTNKNVLDKSIGEVNNTINEGKQKVNDAYQDAVGNVTDKIKNATGLNENSPFKASLNLPDNPLSNAFSAGSGNTNSSSPDANKAKNKTTKIRPSKDKKTSYGSTDFWVVKLKDKDKKETAKVSIEAFPNPASDFTNVIVGYEFMQGEAMLVDIAGRVLKQFKITDRTVPVDLKGLPEGIYIVNIKTEKHSDGIKIIKGIERN